MSNNIFNIEKSDGDILKTLLTNCMKMLIERGVYGDGKDLSTNIDNDVTEIIKTGSDDMVYSMGKEIMCKILPYKITAINKSYGMIEFLDKYKSSKKIIIVKEINTRVQSHIQHSYRNTEIFMEKEMMINLIEHILIPKHILLSKEEANNLIKTYMVQKRQLQRIYNSDPVARYYNAKIGDIFRIVRYSEKAGYGVAYRIVVKGSVK
jgi:DNA-directed RNA polymerase subunit H (RpoH/RPB5)